MRRPVPVARRGPGTRAVRDVPFLALMSTTALLSLCRPLLSSGLPLWLQYRTAAPVWLAPVTVVVSSRFIALYQVRVTRQGESLRGAVRSTRKAAAALGVCCMLFAAAAWPAHAPLASPVVLAGRAAHIPGELLCRRALRGAEGRGCGRASTTRRIGPIRVPRILWASWSPGIR
ncbi:hypothetical protein [Streptomyces sp. MK37H]|uniref:hypothetical protein n=1 Tax=Streptomyces sp. MK37H TaxID=2699117 RepID=UPI001B35A0CB|nr:hypothetical protein [Streptomyces sp. MK37H]MBP8532529.1 hypothetical protein [Streptomyces sp. MK37H]